MMAMNTPIWLAALAVLMAAVCLVFCYLHMARQRKAQVGIDRLQARLVHLEEQNRLVSTGAIGLGHRLLAVEARLQTLQHEQTNHPVDDGQTAYTQASKLLAQGMDVDTVATVSGLSQSEVNLMALMSQKCQGQPVFAKESSSDAFTQ